ncbi:Probable serine/threonine-protein kinase pix13 [Ancistrocladus abbreviatus]
MGNCWGSSPLHDHATSTNLPVNPVGGAKGSSSRNNQWPVTKRANESSSVMMGKGGSQGAASDGMKARSSPPTSGDGSVVPNRVAGEIGRIVTPNLKVYTFAELKSATKDFKPVSLLGEGGFGKVYKGWIDASTLNPSRPGVGIPVAVKKCSSDSEQGHREWQSEVNFLGKFSHPNLVRLIGYCVDEEELLLVYEYMQKGSLEGHLFNKHVEPPPWGTRMKIAMDAARGLDFLHTSENTVIYRDFKAANILLDEGYNAKLSDFGLARLGPANGSSHVTTQAVGTYGYAAPEYIATSHLYVQSDVYGFGVVLLEMLTGLRAYDLKRPTGQHSLVEWCKPFLRDRAKLKKIIDPRMGDYPPEGAQKLSQLILRCLVIDPKSRGLQCLKY